MPLVRPEGTRAAARADSERALALYERVIAANPRVQVYRTDFARILTNLGLLLEEEGLLAEALATFERSRQMRAELVKENPNFGHFRADLSRSCSNLGEVLDKLGRPDEAVRAFEEAIRIRRALIAADPKHLADQEAMASYQEKVAWLLVRVGRPAEALANYRQATAFRLRRANAADPITLYNLACAQAQLSRFAAVKGSGMTPQEASAAADRAIHNLVLAIAGGFRNLEQYRRDTDLDPLRSRPDFQALLLDLAFPRNPFGK